MLYFHFKINNDELTLCILGSELNVLCTSHYKFEPLSESCLYKYLRFSFNEVNTQVSLKVHNLQFFKYNKLAKSIFKKKCTRRMLLP